MKVSNSLAQRNLDSQAIEIFGTTNANEQES